MPDAPTNEELVVRGWRAYYSDGRVFTSLDTPPNSLPDRGLVVLRQFYEGPWRDTIKGDWYVWNGKRWRREALDWPERGWPPRPKGKVVIQGELMEDDEWNKLLLKAVNDVWP